MPIESVFPTLNSYQKSLFKYTTPILGKRLCKTIGFLQGNAKDRGYLEPFILATVSASISVFIHLIFIPEKGEIRKFISAAPMIAVMIPYRHYRSFCRRYITLY